MQIANLPLATGYTNQVYFSDDVDKDTRFYGFYLDLKRTVAEAFFIVAVVSNSADRDANPPISSEVFWQHRIARNQNATKQRENPILVTLDSPVFVPGGVTLMTWFTTASNIDPSSVNVFVER